MLKQLLEVIWSKIEGWLVTSGLRIAVMAVVLWVFIKVVRAVGRRIIRFVEDDDPTTKSEREKRAETLVRILDGSARIVALLAMLYVLLKELGVNVTPLLAGAGIAGIAIGFGAQSIVKDLFHGFFILLENQYRVGDVVKIGAVSGLVEEINLRTTVLRDIEGVKHVIPNGQVQTVSNMSFAWSRAVLDVGISYDADIDKAGAVMKDTAMQMRADPEFAEKVIEDPEVLGVESFGDHAVVLRLVMKTAPLAQWAVAREYRKRLKAAFDRAGIEIPYPQRVVHMAKDR
ncbi:MAG: mechanosensitive ion channel family protein [Deltaproteobacteria bacterium]|nr:mechanosensitive ion channel family protein [Deltaproteobacteria bacterium]